MDLGIIVKLIDEATAPLKGLEGALDSMGQHARTAGDNSQALHNSLKAIDIVLAGIIIEKAIELGNAFIDLASASENADARLMAWAGSAGDATKVLQTLNDTVGAAGVKLETMSNSYVRLRSAGLDSNDAVKTIQSLVNGMAAVGGGDLDQRLNNATEAFARFTSKGVSSTRELNSILSDTGLTVAELAGGSQKVTAFMDSLKDKTLGAQVLIDAFNRAAKEKFGDFASLLNNTVSGALSKFKNDMSLAFAANAEVPGGINNQLTAFIQNLDKAVTDLINTHASEWANEFVTALHDAAPFLAQLGTGIVNLGQALLAVGMLGFQLLSILPQGATEYGIIGYFLLGKAGLLVGAAVGVVDQVMRTALIDAQELAGVSDSRRAALEAERNKSSLDDMLQDIAKFRAQINPQDSGNWLTKLFGTKEQLDAIAAGFKKIGEESLKAVKTPLPENTALDAINAKLRTEIGETLQQVSGQVRQAEMKNAGDELGAAMQGAVDKTLAWNKQLDILKDKVDHSKLSHQTIATADQLILGLQERINRELQNARQYELDIYNYKEMQLGIETAIDTLKSQEESRQLRLATAQLRDPGVAFGQGLSGIQVQEEVTQKQAQLAQQVLQYQDKIAALEKLQRSDAGNATLYARQITDVKRLQAATEDYAKTLSATTLLQQKMLNQLATTLESDVSNGISGLIKGTMTLGDVARSVFGDMIDLAVKWLIQLAEIQIFGEAANAAAVATATPTALALAALWSPAAMAASIATLGTADATGAAAYEAAMSMSLIPHADGGVPGLSGFSNSVVTGPTVFGLMGEAGTEAVMPLKRINGKLGVSTDGMGGDSHFHFHSVDPESNVKFFMSNMHIIQGGLAQRNRLNRGKTQ
jgi:hypothetical protein